MKDKLTKDQLAKADKLHHVMTNHGRYVDSDGGEQLVTMQELKDLITTEDILPLLPKVVTRVIAEAIEPQLLVVPNLFTRLDIPTATHIEIGAIGALTASKIAQGQEFKQETLSYDVSGQSVAVTVSKYGLAVNIAKEVIDDSQFDVITLWLRAAGAALARLKESLGMKLVDTMGVTVFDNATPTASELGVLTGRGIAGSANGSMTLNDLFDMYVYLAQRGFIPDTLIMNPLAWKVFATDSLLKEVVMSGAVLASRRMPLGTYAPGWQQYFGGLGTVTKATGAEATGPSAWVNALNPLGATFNVPPQGVLPSPLKVLVTHVVPFATRANADPLTNIVMADSQRAGVLVQKEEATTDEADIFSRQTHQIQIWERYGMAIFDQGKGIAVARNLVVAQNYVFDNVNQVTLAAINKNTPLA